MTPKDLQAILNKRERDREAGARVEACGQIKKIEEALREQQVMPSENTPMIYAGHVNYVAKEQLRRAGWKIKNRPNNDPLAGPGTYPAWQIWA